MKTNVCIKLNKSLYGLRESPKNWNTKFTETMKDLGYVQSEFEYCLFIKGHFVREKIKSKIISLIYICTEKQVADIFTKPLGRVKFVNFRKELGVF